jgi:hypothetical protein
LTIGIFTLLSAVAPACRNESAGPAAHDEDDCEKLAVNLANGFHSILALSRKSAVAKRNDIPCVARLAAAFLSFQSNCIGVLVSARSHAEASGFTGG